MIGYIYSISPENEENNILYIGASKYPYERLKTHVANIKFQDSPFYKYLFQQNIKIDLGIIEEADVADRKELRRLETYWIHQFREWGFHLKNSVFSNKVTKETNNPSYPIKLGDMKPILQMEAFALNISLHALILKIIRDYLIERGRLPPSYEIGRKHIKKQP